MRPNIGPLILCVGAALARFAAPAAAQTGVTVTVSPASVELTRGQSQQFTAQVAGAAPGATVTIYWSLSGIGSLTTTGYYSAPASVFGSSPVSVTVWANATVVSGGATNTYRGSAAVNLIPTVAISLAPSSATLQAGNSQQFTATVTGTANTGVSWLISPAVGTITADGLYTAPATVTSAQNVTVTATSAADPTKSATATVHLQSSGVSISVLPKTVTLTPSGTQQFTATVTGTSETGVNWSISPPYLGSITGGGLYTAPATVSSSQTVTIAAASRADPSKTANATVTISPQTAVVDVGTGAPNDAIRSLFIQAFYRDGFHNLVTLPPAGQVRRWGTTGYIQEFNGPGNTRYGLVKPDDSLVPVNEQPLVFQIRDPLMSYYSSVGAATAGQPTMDSQPCPHFDPENSCRWGLFSNKYALFAYVEALLSGENFSIRQNFYTLWTAMGGIDGPGRPVEGEISVTSSAGNGATMQTYANGVIYNFTSGIMNGQTWGVQEPLYSLYVSNGRHTGALGFPISNEAVLASGVHRQKFQGGTVEWTPGSDPEVKLPVAAVSLKPDVLRLNYGETARIAVTVTAANGAELPDRPVSWTSSNSLVAAVEPAGREAVVRATGAGTAEITASSEGKISKPATVVVTAPCCFVGEGAPSPAVRQAFLDAVARNRLNVRLPAAGPVERAGSGYVQALESADPNAPAAYLVAKPDSSAAAWVITGEILRRYRGLGGPAGSLGYPVEDATAGGRQSFENRAALAGDPVRLVSGAILAKWAALSYESGAAGAPAGEAEGFFTFGANSGEMQAFRGGSIYHCAAGPRAGAAHLVSGPVLERYTALGGPGGVLGMPVSDEVASGAVRSQQFEGGAIEYAAGGGSATHQFAPRKPAVVAFPAAVAPGSRVRLAVLGFPDGSTVRVSVTGQPDFLVKTANGAHAWEVGVPLGAAPGTVVVRAESGGAGAEASYTVRSFADAGVRLGKVSGDAQTGLPGSRLAQPLRVALRDSGGNPVAGAAVVFDASPGASVSPFSALTDSRGEAQAWLRLAPAEGIAMATANAPELGVAPVTFHARSAPGSLANFPEFRQSGDALLAAAAAVLRYHQGRGELPQPEGPAGPATVKQYLRGFCVAGSSRPLCDGFLINPETGAEAPNLWRLPGFVGGGLDVSVESADIDNIRDLVAQGSPVLLSLALTADGAALRGHVVTAIGVASGGGLLIHDPGAEFARAELGDYAAGFQAGGRIWKGQIRGAVRLLPRAPAPGRFLLAAVSQPADVMDGMALAARSRAGACGAVLELVDEAAPRVSRLAPCDGTEPVYQLDIGAAGPWRATVTDLAGGGEATHLAGNTPAAYRASRPSRRLEVAPQDVAIVPGGVVNAADFTPGLAPGSLMAILGAGLAGAGGPTSVQFGEAAARVVAATPFQVNAEVPLDLSPGTYQLRVESPYGVTEQAVEIRAAAPAIFALGEGRGAVVNQDNRINSPETPAARGETLVVYATGLGPVLRRGDRWLAAAPVSVVLAGEVLDPSFAGLAPGLVGVYQVNVRVPASTPPGIGLALRLRQGGAESGAAPVSVR